MWDLIDRFFRIAVPVWIVIGVAFVLLVLLTPAHGQTESDWEKSRVQVGPGKAYTVPISDPVIIFSGNVQFYLWGVEPRPGFHRELNSILSTAYATCILLGGSGGRPERLNVACKTDHIPDIAAELVARHVAVIDTRSGHKRPRAR